MLRTSSNITRGGGLYLFNNLLAYRGGHEEVVSQVIRVLN